MMVLFAGVVEICVVKVSERRSVGLVLLMSENVSNAVNAAKRQTKDF